MPSARPPRDATQRCCHDVSIHAYGTIHEAVRGLGAREHAIRAVQEMPQVHVQVRNSNGVGQEVGYPKR